MKQCADVLTSVYLMYLIVSESFGHVGDVIFVD